MRPKPYGERVLIRIRVATALVAAIACTAAAALSGCAPSPRTEIADILERLSTVDADDPLWQGDADTCRRGSVDESDPDVTDALAVAMHEAEFWSLIDELHGGNEEEDIARLTRVLAERPVEDLIGFDARLALTMYALDDQCHLVAFRDGDRWDGSWVDGDAFVYARADTIAAGRQAWESALAEGHLDAGETSPMSGELLLYVTLDASMMQGMDELELWDLEDEQFSLSYESGSNPTGWPDGRGAFIISDEDIATRG